MHIVVVEAKAQQGYSSRELCRYKTDKHLLSSALGINPKNVIFVGLCSHTYFDSKRRKIDLSKGFDAVLTWKQIADCWLDADSWFVKHFRRAEYVYNK